MCCFKRSSTIRIPFGNGYLDTRDHSSSDMSLRLHILTLCLGAPCPGLLAASLLSGLGPSPLCLFELLIPHRPHDDIPVVPSLSGVRSASSHWLQILWTLIDVGLLSVSCESCPLGPAVICISIRGCDMRLSSDSSGQRYTLAYFAGHTLSWLYSVLHSKLSTFALPCTQTSVTQARQHCRLRATAHHHDT